MSSKALLLRSSSGFASYQRDIFVSSEDRHKEFRRSVEVWKTTCIVAKLGAEANCSALINPSNSELTGVSNFTYFPRGGPVPSKSEQVSHFKSMHRDWQPLGYVSNWGGMEVGTGMMYPVSVVDGLVHLTGGYKLRAECQWKRFLKHPPCPEGEAVLTSAGSMADYKAIIHTTPPFYKHYNGISSTATTPEACLRRCYDNALQLAFSESRLIFGRVACPLLGAGARGFPVDVAVTVAAQACRAWLQHASSTTVASNGKKSQQVLVFGLLEDELCDLLAERLGTLNN
jgi:O-acetyl-ADP-ribose deacetylase (regulator of RNase III)